MNIIYVDDEIPALENFYYTVYNFKEIDELKLFEHANDALEYAKNNKIDIAFLDIEMHECKGLELAKKLIEINQNIKIIFVTAYNQYALEAFNVNAIGYILKPYLASDIKKEIEKASRIKPILKHKIIIQTIPDLILKIDDKIISFSRSKVEELFALLVDRGNNGLTTGEAISILWPNRGNDETTKALYRNTFKRLLDMLKQYNIEDIICSDYRRKYIDINKVDCDLYNILNNDLTSLTIYNGEYMRSYSWAEEKNAWLYSLKEKFENN